MPRPSELIVRGIWRHYNFISTQELEKNVRSLLNKITPTTFEDLCAEFLRYDIHRSDVDIRLIAEVLHSKAIEEPLYAPLYSDLCKRQYEDEQQHRGTNRFVTALLTLCDDTFRTFGHSRAVTDISANNEGNGGVSVTTDRQEREARRRWRVFGNIAFLVELYRNGLIPSDALDVAVRRLLTEDPDSHRFEESVECALRLLEPLGRLLYTSGAHLGDQGLTTVDFDGYLGRLQLLQARLSRRLQLLILNLLELHQNGWTSVRANDRIPRTLQEIRDERDREWSRWRGPGRSRKRRQR